MLINGEKYACEACVRGHRVSSCTHSDRKLLHVNKKGRPVSQCQHCRSLRKARSQHVKCDCQDKAHAKEDCPHLKVEQGAMNTEEHTCCCGHGARCTCALKRENSLDTVLENFPHVIQPKDPHKHRISSLNSHESKATVFVNGHHKPVHKINDAHNHCGAPYRKPSRSHTVHGHREFAQRSTDSLPLLRQAPKQSESPLHNVTSAPDQIRKVKSEHNSPELGPTNPQLSAVQELFIPPLSPNAYSYSPFDSQPPSLTPTGSFDLPLPETIPDSWFMTYDEAHKNDTIPCTSFNKGNFSDTPPVDWSQYGSCGTNADQYPIMGNGFMSNQSASYSMPFEHINMASYPRVNSSSGEVSETDDHSTLNRPSNLRTVSNASNDLSSPGDEVSENNRLSTASSYHGTPQAGVLAGTLGNLDIDEFVAQAVAESSRRRNIQRQQSSNQTPPIQRTQTPPARQGTLTPPIPRSSHTPPVSNSTHSPAIPHNYQLSQLQQLQQQQMQLQTLQSQQTQQSQQSAPSVQNPNLGGFNLAQIHMGSEHPFTLHEAQMYAHMGGGSALNMQSEPGHSSMPASLIEDPMWSAPMGTFKLDDPREDEDWVR